MWRHTNNHSISSQTAIPTGGDTVRASARPWETHSFIWSSPSNWHRALQQKTTAPSQMGHLLSSVCNTQCYTPLLIGSTMTQTIKMQPSWPTATATEDWRTNLELLLIWKISKEGTILCAFQSRAVSKNLETEYKSQLNSSGRWRTGNSKTGVAGNKKDSLLSLLTLWKCKHSFVSLDDGAIHAHVLLSIPRV